MNAVREIIDSSKLDKIITLPDELKNKQVELIILPVSKKEENKDGEFKPEDYIGILKIKDIDKKLKEMRDEWERK